MIRLNLRRRPIGAPLRGLTAGGVLLLGGLSARAAEDEASVFVEWSCEANPCYETSPFWVDVVVGVEKDFLNERMVQPFQRELELPVRVDAAWIDAPIGATRREDSPENHGPTLVVNGEVVHGEWTEDRRRDDRSFVVARYRSRFIAGAAGPLVLPPPTAHFVYASTFRDDLFMGRVPLDRSESTVVGGGVTIDVVSLPSVGKPVGFQGAIGSFSIRSDITKSRLGVGETTRVTIEVSGDGDLDSIPSVHPIEIDGWHRLGRLEERGPTSRRFLYDLELISSDVVDFPPVVLNYFDPAAGEYRTSTAPPLPIVVDRQSSLRSEMTPASAAEDRATQLRPLISIDEIETRAPATSGWEWEMLVLLLPWGVAPWLAARVRRRDEDRDDPDRVRARLAYAQFQEAIEKENVDVAPALVSYLAARMRVVEAAVITPDLVARLIERGGSRPVAEALASLIERLSSARYGGESTAGATAEASRLVTEFEESIKSGGTR